MATQQYHSTTANGDNTTTANGDTGLYAVVLRRVRNL